MNTTIKKVLISGYIGFENFGDDIIFSSLLKYLKSKNLDISALSSKPNETKKEFGVNSFYYKSLKDIFYSILKTDCLISGGGSLLQNETSNKSLIYYLLIIFLAKLFNKKVIIFAQGIGPVYSKPMQILVCLILKMCDFISVRDNKSQEFLSKFNIKSVLVSDPAWGLELNERKTGDVIGIQLRQYNKMHPHFLDNLACAINSSFPNKRIRVFAFQNAQDTEISEKFVNLLKSDYNNYNAEVILNTSTDKITADFSELEYLIAMRFHAVLLGLKYKITTLPIVYDIKVQSLADEFKIEYLNCEFGDEINSFSDKINVNSKIMQTKSKAFDWSLFDEIFKDKEKT